jgi:hypothetical protein
VVGGTRHKDIVAPPWRYFQYSYTLRLIADNQFGKDVDIPSVQLVYNVQSTGAGAERGRDQIYILPLLPVRILSLVPITANDIWDTTAETFGDIESRQFRANGEFMAATMFFALAIVMAGFAVVRGVGRYRAVRVADAPAAFSVSSVLAACIREAERLKADVAIQGWTPQLLARALTIFRIAGAAAVGRRIAQTIVKTDVPEREGQLMLRRGLLRPTRAVVSASTTPMAMRRPAAPAAAGARSLSSLRSAETADVVEHIQEALRVFSAARYARHTNADVSALDTALENALASIRHVHVSMRWPMRAIDTFAKAAAGFRETVLSR